MNVLSEQSVQLRRASTRLLLSLITVQVCLHTSVAGLRLSAPLQVLRSGLGQWAVGPLMGLFSLAPILVALPAGRLADRRGYHAPVRLAAALIIVACLAAMLGTRLESLRYPLLCLAAMCAGAGGNIGLITIQRSASRSARDVDELKRIFSWLGIAPSLSSFLGPLLAGLLIDHGNFAITFAALSVLPLLGLGLAMSVARDTGKVSEQERARPRRAAWELLASPMLRRLLLVNWCMSTSWDVHSFLVPVLGNQRGMSASAIGTVLGLMAVSVTSVRLVLPLFAHRFSEAQALTWAMWIVVFVFILYPFAPSALAMSGCALLLGVALGTSQPMVMTTLHQLTPPERHGEAIALRSMVISVSSSLMPLTFGVLGAAAGAAGLFWMMSALVACGSLAARSLHSRG